MADSKITALTAISTVDPTADPLVIVDVSDTSMAASGTTKKSTINQLLGAGGTATLASATITGAATVGTTLGVTGAATVGTTLLVGTNATLTNGNVILGTSGKGIDFSATTSGSGTMTSELLNDYEEGTWTGTLKGSVSDPTTPVTATGRYTKVGRVVTVQMSFSNVDTNGASGAIGITGLPFAGVSGITQIGTFSTINGTTVTNGAIWAIDGSLTALNALSTDWNSLNHSAGTTRYFMLNLTYTVA